MITKNIKHNMVVLAMGCGIAFTTVGCNDFLDVLPLNEVVLENYWTKKSDVTSVLMGCYESLAAGESVTRMGLWGEVRSDNVKMGNSSSQDLEQMLKENILPTNNYCNWTAFYQTINRCNTVIHYAPQVQAIDPNYTQAEMKANIAEATFIRSLCYFYLIRTFRDVPFTRKPSIDDTEEYRIPADSFNVVLGNIIADMEAVKDDAQMYFRKPKSDSNVRDAAELENTARVTRPAMYALLADLYLWKGDWDKCIASCDYVISFKQEEYDKLLKRRLQNEVQLFNDIPLYLEEISSISGYAYNAIFGQGNSFESIFEITYDNSNSSNPTNSYVGSFYSHRNNNALTSGNLVTMEEFYKGLPQKKTDLFDTKDCRAYENIYENGKSYWIAKYSSQSTRIEKTTSTWRPAYSWRSSDFASWIIYRLTDVMLMKAEALVEQGSDKYQDAFDLVNAVNRRAVNSKTPGTGEVLAFADFKNSLDDMRTLVMDERHRELMFEGKRWYDLVRMARRTGSTKSLAKTVTQKQLTNIGGIQIRLADPNALYFPYFRNELKVNPYLKQNPAYNTGGDDDLEKN